MILFVCVTFVMFLLVCLVAVCIAFAVDGFEDSEGFHAEPAARSGPAVVGREMKIKVSPQQPVGAASAFELAAD